MNDVYLSYKLQAFVAKRDRQALIRYKASLDPQSEDYLYAENVLHELVRFHFNAGVVIMELHRNRNKI